eukprot:TRINITY_DN11679_c0_g1_i1.p1 TRINITY_DN11679_c0_g1~~TRINITY_DN11679_c0_g1_i1.p1  ORF type:complete len:516 (+),score=27.89 TRINITY_DN11679_c0_g1_i1:103-1548(+)
MEEAECARLYVVQEVGPTSFVLRDESDRRYIVRIGSLHTCSVCSKAGSELCIHILFVILRVFRLQRDNPLSWQQSLVDAEVDAVLAGRAQKVHEATRTKLEAAAKGITEVPQRPIGPSDVCPICVDTLTNGETAWCRKGCGNSLHTACFEIWAAHRTNQVAAVTCPVCRAEWEAGEVAGLSGAAHPRMRCFGCSRKICGTRYKCMVCKSTDLCTRCFAKNSHSNHPFLLQHAVGGVFEAAPRGPFGTTVPAEIAAVLQGRELTADDYDVLNQLDRMDLSSYTASVLPVRPVCAGEAPCVVCNQPHESGSLRLLLCGHTLHRDCAKSWAINGSGRCPIDRKRTFYLSDKPDVPLREVPKRTSIVSSKRADTPASAPIDLVISGRGAPQTQLKVGQLRTGAVTRAPSSLSGVSSLPDLCIGGPVFGMTGSIASSNSATQPAINRTASRGHIVKQGRLSARSVITSPDVHVSAVSLRKQPTRAD